MKWKIATIFLLAGCLLLNSTPGLANVYKPAAMEGRQVLTPKDQAVLDKFSNIKQWLEKQKPLIEEYFHKALADFKHSLAKLLEGMQTTLNELKKQVIDQFYYVTEVPSTNTLPDAGRFFFISANHGLSSLSI